MESEKRETGERHSERADHPVERGSDDYVIRMARSPAEISRAQWNTLLELSCEPSPFMRHEYLCALHESDCASPQTGWTARYVSVWRGDELQAACPFFLKHHSRGEYVFDWSWADAHAQAGLAYYPKGLVAVPFTPVPGARLLARDGHARTVLLQALLSLCEQANLSSLHLLFLQPEDIPACEAQGLLLRKGIQFHWTNDGYRDFDHFLASLQQVKRKKIRQERRKVAEAGIRWRVLRGADITTEDWSFFYRCYENTYLEHGNPPYLTRSFFQRMAQEMPAHWLMFVAETDTQPVACSLIAIDDASQVAYGRYWGSTMPIDCLHFEACYYRPLDWCIQHGYRRFEGGAQGEHKMARALLPVETTSAHWLRDPRLHQAVGRFLQRESHAVDQYQLELLERSPIRQHRD